MKKRNLILEKIVVPLPNSHQNPEFQNLIRSSHLSVPTATGEDVRVPTEDGDSVGMASHGSNQLRPRHVPDFDGTLLVANGQDVAFRYPENEALTLSL